MLKCFKLLFFAPTSIYTTMVKQKKKNNCFNMFANLLKIKNVNIPLHKYSYPYLGQLEFSSGAFILLVGVTKLWVKVTCGKFNWMGMIWKGTHVLIKGDNAYQSKNQAPGSKEQSVERRNWFASNHTSGEEFRKKTYSSLKGYRSM